MRTVLRRILWIVPTLFVVSIGAFFVLTAGAGWQLGQDSDETEHPLFGRHHPPRFFNSNPTSVSDLAARAMTSIARDDEDAPEARTELVRLGGAALPYVLPKLDALPPTGRARVALALAPLGERMNVGSPEELRGPETAILFWTRFWQDRGIDFRPGAAKRAVWRLAQKSTSGRRDDVQHFDTFALSELITAMPPVQTDADLTRVRRLASMAAKVTGRPLTLSSTPSIAEAQKVVAEWQAFWLEHHTDYSTLDGAERVFAMVSETQYGRWAGGAARGGLGVTQSGERVLSVLSRRAPVTLWLLASALSAGYAAGILLGLFAAARPRRPLDLSTSVLCVVGSSLSVALFCSVLSPSGAPPAARLLGALVMALFAGSIVSRHQRAAARVALDQEYTRTARAFGAGPWRIAARSFRSSAVSAVSLAGVDLPALLTAAFVVEQAFGLGGLSTTTLAAIAQRDIAWLMALSLGVVCVLALAQIISDSLLSTLDPRVAVGFARKRGGLE